MTETPQGSGAIPVFLGRCTEYDRAAVSATVEEMAPALGLPHSFAGRTVLLKPNPYRFLRGLLRRFVLAIHR